MKLILKLLLLFSVVKFEFLFFNYLSFIYKPRRVIEARVIAQYKKRDYYVLKLKNREVTFYTTTYEDLKNLINDKLRLKIFTKNLSFLGYLTSFYAPSYDIKLLPLSKVDKFIEIQHKERKISNLFRALFLGESMDYQTRLALSSLGIAHLFALSGLHLGIISFLVFFIVRLFYSFFHKYFPYRNLYFDVGLIVLGVEFLYLYFTNFPPSLIRAYLLEVILFFMFFTLRDVLRFRVLGLLLGVSFLFFTFSVFTLGFLLSFLGVFYIYLFFNYFKPNFKNSILLSFYLFVVMSVYSFYFFHKSSDFIFLAPFITLLFPFFYVVEVVLHLLNMGGSLDFLVKGVLSLGKVREVDVSLVEVLVFLFLSLMAIKKKWAFYGINVIGLIFVLRSFL